MKVLVNNTEIHFPTTLAEITLGQRIAYNNLYGQDLQEAIKSIEAMQDGALKNLEWAVLNMDLACKQFSFFSGIALEVVQQSQSLEPIMQVYEVMNKLLADDATAEYKSRFEWDGVTWELHPPELKSTSTLTFGELIDSKQILQDMHEMGEGRWERLQRLCAIYLRKEEEPYSKAFGDEEGERVKLMENLPLDIALSVGFFLSSSMSLYWKHLAVSAPAP